MPTGIYDRTKSKPNAGEFQKGEHPSPLTEIKKGQRLSPITEFQPHVGSGLSFADRNCLTREWSRKQSKSHWGQHNSPSTEFKRGIHYSPETEFGELVLGGVSTEEMLTRASPEYVRWRRAVYERDNYTCQWCGEYAGRLEAHHIEAFATHPEVRLEVSNGITLCKTCHRGGDASARGNDGRFAGSI